MKQNFCKNCNYGGGSRWKYYQFCCMASEAKGKRDPVTKHRKRQAMTSMRREYPDVCPYWEKDGRGLLSFIKDLWGMCI